MTTKQDPLITIEIGREGVGRISIFTDDDASQKAAHQLLALITGQLRALSAAIRLADFETLQASQGGASVGLSVGELKHGPGPEEKKHEGSGINR